MDLKPIKPKKEAPRYEDGSVIWGRYNWTGWRFLVEKLAEWGVDISEFSAENGGKSISARTCKAVADALEQHLPELTDLKNHERDFLRQGIKLWRTCGGYRQF